MSKSATFVITPTRLGRLLVVGIYILVFVLILLLTPPWELVAVASIVLASGGVFFWQSLSQKEWQLNFDGESWCYGINQQPLYLKAYYFLPGIISLQFSTQGNQSRRLLLFADSLSTEQWRNVRRICRGF